MVIYIKENKQKGVWSIILAIIVLEALVQHG